MRSNLELLPSIDARQFSGLPTESAVTAALTPPSLASRIRVCIPRLLGAAAMKGVLSRQRIYLPHLQQECLLLASSPILLQQQICELQDLYRHMRVP